MSLLEVRDLSLELGGRCVLSRLNFSLAKGEITGLVGESGCGKTLTALTLMGLQPQQAVVSGAINFNGQDLLQLREMELCRLRGAQLAMVFQEPVTALNPLQSIGAQVIEVVRLHRQDLSLAAARQLAAATLHRVELGNVPLSSYPHQLSVGQRQRVLLAIAVVLRPRLLIADEPTTALDPQVQKEILQLLRSLVHQEQSALLLISHDIAMLARTTDRLLMLHQGVISTQQGPPALLTSRMPRHAATILPRPTGKNLELATSSAVPLLQVRELSYRYRRPTPTFWAKATYLQVLHQISFQINRGEIVGLIGKSGCGKSTLARTILGLGDGADGEILLAGRPLHRRGTANRELRRQIQLVLQDPFSSFNPRHRLWRLVSEPLYLLPDKYSRQEITSRVSAVLEKVGLSGCDLTSGIDKFSGGQRQRIALARALIINPELIVLDEVLSSLDLITRQQIINLLLNLKSRLQLSYLLISHDFKVVEAISDRVLVMQDGRIIEHGCPQQIFTAPQQSYTRDLIAAGCQ